MDKSEELQEQLDKIKHEREEAIAKKLAETLNLPYINLTITPIDPNDLVILPKEKAQKGNALIIKKSGQMLRIAVKNPKNSETQKIIKEFQDQGFECNLFIASLNSLKKGWERYELSISHRKEQSVQGVFNIKKEDLEEFKNSLKTIQDLQKAITGLSTSRLLTIILAGSIEMKASDIHLEPGKEGIRLRYRIDGLLQDIAIFPTKEYHFLISRIKSLSDMLLNVVDISQDGRFTTKISGKNKDLPETIDLRVSLLPTNYGESIVMRLLGTSTIKLTLDNLGIRPELFKLVKGQIDKPNGLILTTGPTGSGKTTTLYSCLNYVNQPGTKIITVEDPIEYKLEGITQTPISSRKGHTFGKALRAIVRQDPDILMLGEIRDRESAEIAIEFALTGHIVFSTIHTNEAAGAVPRLFGMGISPNSLASSLNLIIAQRLVRKLCPYCKEEYKPSNEIIKAIKKILSSIPSNLDIKIPKDISVIYRAKGCEKCHNIGYRGRIGIFEFLKVTDSIKESILSESAAFEIQKKAEEEGMITLIQDAVINIIEGKTSLEEVERIIGSLEN